MVDHQHVLTGADHITQVSEPVDARNVNGHNQIDITTHGIGINQKPAAGQRPQGLRKRCRRCEADLDGLAAPVQHQGQRQPGPDRVGIGMDMADHSDRRGGGHHLRGADGVDASRCLR
jgi:hypothetical protein